MCTLDTITGQQFGKAHASIFFDTFAEIIRVGFDVFCKCGQGEILHVLFRDYVQSHAGIRMFRFRRKEWEAVAKGPGAIGGENQLTDNVL